LNSADDKKSAPEDANANSRGVWRSQSVKISAVIAILAFPIFVLFAYYSSLKVVASNAPLFKFFNPGSPNNLYITSTANYSQITIVLNTSAIQNTQQFPNFLPSISIPEAYIIGAIVIAFLIVGITVVRNVRRQNSVSSFDAEDYLEKQRDQIAKLLDDTISELKHGDECRRTILECYRRISELLEAKSSINGKSLTAREFEKKVSTSLKLESPYLEQVTEIFEIARYSQKELSKADADAAIDSLSNLSIALRG
jgi:hypothetical protein